MVSVCLIVAIESGSGFWSAGDDLNPLRSRGAAVAHMREKAMLGITIDTGRVLAVELAFNHGIDFGRGRRRGIGL